MLHRAEFLFFDKLSTINKCFAILNELAENFHFHIRHN